MPRTVILIYKEVGGNAPLLDWMDTLPSKIVNKWTERFESLAEYGYELGRPIRAPLRDKIHELRVDKQRLHYRVLYTYVGKNIVLLSHGCLKIRKVSDAEIDLAIQRRENFLRDPDAHTYIEG